MEIEKTKSDEELDALLVDLFAAMSSIDTSNEADLVLRDLMSKKEIRNIARRLRIAIMLVCGCSYSEVAYSIGAATDTISRVSHWLDYRGGGYRLIIERMGEAAEIDKLVRRGRTQSKACAHDKRKKIHGPYAEWFWPVEIITAIVNGIKPAPTETTILSKTTPLLHSAGVVEREAGEED